MRTPQVPRNIWYRTGKDAEQLNGPVTRPQLESLAKRGLIFPETPVAEADAGGKVENWRRAQDWTMVAQIFYATGALLLELRQPPPPRPLIETAELIRSDVEATRHMLVTLRSGVKINARFVGDPLVVWMHFDVNRVPMICLGPDGCRICPARRVKNGYVDALMHSAVDTGDYYYRAAIVLPEAALRQLEVGEGESLRGRLYSICWMKGSATKVALLQLRCDYALDDPAEIRHVVIRRYGLPPEWPARTVPPAEGESDILKFRRRQA